MEENPGFELFRDCLPFSLVESLREEVERLKGADDRAGARNLFARSDAIRNLALSCELRALLPSEEHRPVRSLLFDKTAEKNWPVAWHQDRSIAVASRKEIAGFGPWSEKTGIPHVEPPPSLLESMATLRIHLDPTPEDNGPLLVCPGSHQLGFLDSTAIEEFSRGPIVTVSCQPGDVLRMSPLLLHSSRRSQSPSRRRVLHFEYARRSDLPKPLEWYEDAEADSSPIESSAI